MVGRKVDNSLPFSPEVRNTWNYTSTPKCLHGLRMEKFTLFFRRVPEFRKATISFVTYPCSSVCPFVHMKQLDSHCADYHEFNI